jgi:hypothetical protein
VRLSQMCGLVVRWSCHVVVLFFLRTRHPVVGVDRKGRGVNIQGGNLDPSGRIFNSRIFEGGENTRYVVSCVFGPPRRQTAIESFSRSWCSSQGSQMYHNPSTLNPLGPVARPESETAGNGVQTPGNARNPPEKPISCLFEVGGPDLNQDLFKKGATGPRGLNGK